MERDGLHCPKCASPRPDLVRQRTAYQRLRDGSDVLDKYPLSIDTLYRCGNCKVLFSIVEFGPSDADDAPIDLS